MPCFQVSAARMNWCECRRVGQAMSSLQRSHRCMSVAAYLVLSPPFVAAGTKASQAGPPPAGDPAIVPTSFGFAGARIHPFSALPLWPGPVVTHTPPTTASYLPAAPPIPTFFVFLHPVNPFVCHFPALAHNQGTRCLPWAVGDCLRETPRRCGRPCPSCCHCLTTPRSTAHTRWADRCLLIVCWGYWGATRAQRQRVLGMALPTLLQPCELDHQSGACTKTAPAGERFKDCRRRCLAAMPTPCHNVTAVTAPCRPLQYTQSNARFAVTVDPSNAALLERKQRIDEARAKVRLG